MIDRMIKLISAAMQFFLGKVYSENIVDIPRKNEFQLQNNSGSSNQKKHIYYILKYIVRNIECHMASIEMIMPISLKYFQPL